MYGEEYPEEYDEDMAEDEEDNISEEDEDEGMGPIEGLSGEHGMDVEVIVEEDDDEDDNEDDDEDDDDEEHDSEDDDASNILTAKRILENGKVTRAIMMERRKITKVKPKTKMSCMILRPTDL
jgi:hypothetical protein